MNRSRKRLLSLLTANIMLVSMLPSYLNLSNPAKRPLTVSAADDSPTNLTIDFNQNAPSAEQVLQDMYFKNRDALATLDYDFFQDNYDKYHWKHVTNWNCNSSPNDVSYWGRLAFYQSGPGRVKTAKQVFSEYYPYSLRACLESTSDDDTYVALAADDSHDEYQRDKWEPVVITKDKVLDLNGHYLEIRFDRNRENNDKHEQQHSTIDTHQAYAFEIAKGATLTIIDSSAWRNGGTDGKGTGRIAFTGYMIDPYAHDIDFYTTRDMFFVEDGNLVIYGGTFQAGRKKTQIKSKFTWDKLKTAIGSAVEMGVSVAEYATGLNLATAKYEDVAANLKQQVDKTALKESKDTGDNDSTLNEGSSDVKKRDGKDDAATKEADEKTKDPDGSRDKTVGEKSGEKKESENKSNEKENAKDDSHTKLAEAQNNIVNKATSKSAIGSIVDSAFGLVDSIQSMIGYDSKTRVTQSIKGTVVKVGAGGTFVAYGGTFQGYGSTPNTRNAVIEVVNQPDANPKTWDKTKNAGGLAYIYGGNFEAYNGANVFNMVRDNKNTQMAWQYTANRNGTRNEPSKVELSIYETGGVEVLYYQNQTDLTAGKRDENGYFVKPVPINTANVQVRGGTFRCFYDLMNVAIRNSRDDDCNFYKFPGTSGCVNLGVESFNNDLIQDGRIQIVDRYGDGALVLMDERSEEEAGDQGLYHYRLFCGDTELRFKDFLEVYPNPHPQIRASKSMELAIYTNSQKSSKNLFRSDGTDNIRAPYRQTENYFDYNIIGNGKDHVSVMPNFRLGGTEKVAADTDYTGKQLHSSEVWYYPVPRTAEYGNEIPDVAYGDIYASYKDSKTGKFMQIHDRDLKKDAQWNNTLKYAAEGSKTYYRDVYSSIRRNLHYFTYKVYRVDPLSRENISESDSFGVDEPLITVRYGDVNDALKCKVPLEDLEQEIAKKKGDPNWHYQDGEMYRIILCVDEYMEFGNGLSEKLPTAQTETSILFRCFTNYEETESTQPAHKEHIFTPVQWLNDVKSDSVAQVTVRNGKAGMTDYWGDAKIFDLYYQWWEVDEKGKEIRMIAGTDNIYDRSKGDKDDHLPEGWNFNAVNAEGKPYTYVNTVDPLDPLADTYDTNGLPKRNGKAPVDWNWEDYQIHMYSAQLTDKEKLTQDGTKNLELGNNNVFATNTDQCYIPEDMAGKYLRVKVIALNTEWPMAFDAKQTFVSEVMKVEESHEPLRPAPAFKYSSGMKYGTYDKPVTVSVSSEDGWKWLAKGETISSVTYYMWNSGRRKEFTDLKVTKPSELPTAKFPDDFYDADYDLRKVKGREMNLRVRITTEKGGKPFRESDLSEELNFNYAVEAQSVICCGEEVVELKFSDVLSGKYSKFGYSAFMTQPQHATVGFSYKDYTSTNPKVATLDEKGNAVFGGAYGEATLSVNSPDGKRAKKTFRIINDYESFEITGIKPPVIGEPLDFTSPAIPKGAPYHIKDVKWYQRFSARHEEEVSPENTAQYFYPYAVEITVESNECCEADDYKAEFSLTAEQSDGTEEIISERVWQSSYAWQGYDYDAHRDTQEFTFRYTYPAQSDHEAASIDKVYMDFPTEVPEGTNWNEWLKNVHIYTNGYDEGFAFKIYPTYGADAYEIAKTYGYDIGSGVQIQTFIKGVQTGLRADITIPDELLDIGDVFAKNVTLYVNGEEMQGQKLGVGSGSRIITAPDTLTVTDGRTAEAMPDYLMQRTDAVAGETISLSELLVSSDPRVSVRMTEIRLDKDWDEFFTYDMEAGTLTPIKAYQFTLGSGWLYIYYDVIFDADGDGNPEYVRPGSYMFEEIYADASDVPEKQAETAKNITVTVLKPDGKRAFTEEIAYLTSADLPELADAFVTGYYDSEGKRVGIGAFKDGESYTAKTVSADAIEIFSGTDCAYAFIRDSEGVHLSGLQISADGVHYTAGERISGLTPQTDYTLSYRYGRDGEIYSMPFRTAKQEYGVYVGHTPVTEANLGILDSDGWHYDPGTKTLTLRNMTLADTGTICSTEQFAGYSVNFPAVIWSADALTVNLTGDNRITCLSKDLGSACIYAEKDLTITGNGSLTLENGQYGLESNTADITLKSSGRLAFDSNTALNPLKGTVYYENGTIDYKPEIREINDNFYQAGGILSVTDKDKLDFSGAVHSITVEAAGQDGKYETAAASDIPDILQKNYDAGSEEYRKCYLRITPKHSDVNQIVSAENHASGTCGEGCTYYLSCDCGHIGEETFAAGADSHSLVKHPAVAATCGKPGTAAYWECTNCGQIFADAKAEKPVTGEELILAPTAHKMQHFEGKEATCTEDGSEEYWKCVLCGDCFSDKDGSHIIAPESIFKPALGHDRIGYGKKAPTCTEDGMIAHWKCRNCGELSADSNGTILLTEEDVTEPALGHIWGEWATVLEATDSEDGEEARSCSRCGESETKVIPAKNPPVTTEVTTATTKATTATTEKVTTKTTKATTATTEKVTTRTTKATTATTEKVTTKTTKTTTATTEKVTTKTTKATTGTTEKTTTTTATVTTTTEPETEPVFAYEVNADGRSVTITKYNGSDSEAVIPDALGGLPVNEIGSEAFLHNDSLKKLTIPEGVKVIGSNAFSGCSVLAEIIIPESVAEIGGCAFRDTPWLSSEQEKSPLVIVNQILIDGTAASGSITVPEGVRCISGKAFAENKELTGISLPESAAEIQAEAFAMCDNLESVTIPDSVTVIRENAFAECPKLTVRGNTGSAAESFAQETGLPFEEISAEPETDKGDVNGSGDIGVEDAQLTLNAYVKCIAGKPHGLTEQQFKAADVNEDGTISVDDAQLILFYYVKNNLAGVPTTWDTLLGRTKPANPLPAIPADIREFLPADEASPAER